MSHANPGDRVAVSVTAGNDATNTEEKATVAVRSTGLLKALAAVGALALVAGIFVMSGRDGTPTSGAIVAAPTTTARPQPVVVTIVDGRREIPAETTTVPPTTTTIPSTTTTTMPAPSTTAAATNAGKDPGRSAARLGDLEHLRATDHVDDGSIADHDDPVRHPGAGEGPARPTARR
jgi:hypothetical protein